MINKEHIKKEIWIDIRPLIRSSVCLPVCVVVNVRPCNDQIWGNITSAISNNVSNKIRDQVEPVEKLIYSQMMIMVDDK